MAWIEIEPGIFAEKANPDPVRILTTEQMQLEVAMLQQESDSYTWEITNMSERKAVIDAKIAEIQTLIGG